MREEERELSGQLFNPGDPELKALKRKAHKLSQDYNALYEDETEQRGAILQELFARIGEGTFLQGPIQIHYGCHTAIGAHCFINFHFTVQDDAQVTIGDHCNFGPNVTIVTPIHPLIAEERRSIRCDDGIERRLCYARPVVIGHDCWFGANVTVCPGVEIGDNCVIGAGSVVTRSIPSNTFAAGVPARVIREITEKDSIRNLFVSQGDRFRDSFL